MAPARHFGALAPDNAEILDHAGVGLSYALHCDLLSDLPEIYQHCIDQYAVTLDHSRDCSWFC